MAVAHLTYHVIFDKKSISEMIPGCLFNMPGGLSIAGRWTHKLLVRDSESGLLTKERKVPLSGTLLTIPLIDSS
jgi:hypothetical protein